MKFARFGKGRPRHKRGSMNKTEAEYELTLKVRLNLGSIEWYQFEAITFKLAHDTRYTPDFAVMSSDGTIEFHEVKSARIRKQASGSVVKPHFEDDARVKLQIAAGMFPFRFLICYLDPNVGWIREEVKISSNSTGCRQVW